MRHRLLLILSFVTLYGFSQEIEHIDINEINKGFRAPDSLKLLKQIELKKMYLDSLDYFKLSYGNLNYDSLKATIVKTYIEKAKTNNDSIAIGRGYNWLFDLYEWNEAYVDTCIYFTKNSKHSNYPTTCYGRKIASQYIKGQYK